MIHDALTEHRLTEYERARNNPPVDELCATHIEGITHIGEITATWLDECGAWVDELVQTFPRLSPSLKNAYEDMQELIHDLTETLVDGGAA